MKIAVGYKAGSGKDTFCKYVANMLESKNQSVKVMSLSSPIYNILAYAQKISGLPQQKDRKFLQLVGSEWGRNIDKDIWIKKILSDANSSECEHLLISDVRYKNEFFALKNEGWTLIKIVRDADNSSRLCGGIRNHSSEVDLEDLSDTLWNFIIPNNDTKQHFFSLIDEVIDQL